MEKLVVVSLMVLNDAMAFVILPISTRPLFHPPCAISSYNTKKSPVLLFGEIPKFINVFDAWNALTKQTKAASPGHISNELVKNDLLAIIGDSGDNTNIVTKRAKVEGILDAVTAASPVDATSASPKLSKDWEVIWTTEKEINLFYDQGWATNIYQVVDNQSRTIENSIPFVKDRGSLIVKGTITPSKERRTEFVFTAAILTIANPWNTKQKFSIHLPPVGKGWFDTLYLDDTLRVDINSRDDILVCRPVRS